jgi:hypothetical protein
VLGRGQLTTDATVRKSKGEVLKRLTALCRSGASRDWIKVTTPDRPAMPRAPAAQWLGPSLANKSARDSIATTKASSEPLQLFKLSTQSEHTRRYYNR